MSTWRAALAEGIATLLFVFLGAGSAVVSGMFLAAPEAPFPPARIIAIALSHGLGIALLAWATGHISGGFLNPAITIAAALTRRLGAGRALAYIVAQLGGAVLGAYLLKLVIPAPAQGSLGATTLGEGMSTGAGLLAEAVFTFAIAFVVYATAMDGRGPKTLAPLAIGLTIVVDALVGVPLTGASMNPARTLGPAVAAGVWADHWVYWVGPLVGASLAALAYETLFTSRNGEKG
ncbi:MAG: aquaporin [Dehalococcoidia bacterium]|nr:aquaporin [Dehalococcoidia bacterium]MDW8119524.1 MIP family channel protein [Chloroflexota bacterium]